MCPVAHQMRKGEGEGRQGGLEGLIVTKLDHLQQLNHTFHSQEDNTVL